MLYEPSVHGSGIEEATLELTQFSHSEPTLQAGSSSTKSGVSLVKGLKAMKFPTVDSGFSWRETAGP